MPFKFGAFFARMKKHALAGDIETPPTDHGHYIVDENGNPAFVNDAGSVATLGVPDPVGEILVPYTALPSNAATMSVTIPANSYRKLEVEIEMTSDYNSIDGALLTFNGDSTSANYHTGLSYVTNSSASAGVEYGGTQPGGYLDHFVGGNTVTGWVGMPIYGRLNIYNPNLNYSGNIVVVSAQSHAQYRTLTPHENWSDAIVRWENASVVTSIDFTPIRGALLIANYCAVMVRGVNY